MIVDIPTPIPITSLEEPSLEDTSESSSSLNVTDLCLEETDVDITELLDGLRSKALRCIVVGLVTDGEPVAVATDVAVIDPTDNLPCSNSLDNERSLSEGGLVER